MIHNVTLIGSRWWPIAVALVGAWVTARNLLRVYREHCADEMRWAEENWSSADEWVGHARQLIELSEELAEHCLRNADECERQAARWFVKGCGG